MRGLEVIELRDAIETLGDQLTSDEETKYEDVLVRRERLRRKSEGSSSFRASEKRILIRGSIKPGRNDPCWCGSGRKYKKCHLDADRATLS